MPLRITVLERSLLYKFLINYIEAALCRSKLEIYLFELQFLKEACRLNSVSPFLYLDELFA